MRIGFEKTNQKKLRRNGEKIITYAKKRMKRSGLERMIQKRETRKND